MGSFVSKPRSLPKSVPNTSLPQMKRTHNVDQLLIMKEKLLKDSKASQTQDTSSKGTTTNSSENKTVSDFISKRLGNLKIEKEYLQLDPDHSSLKRLSNKKKLEDDYKKIISDLDKKEVTILDVNVFKEVLMSVNSVAPKELMNRFHLSQETYKKIWSLSQAISIPTTKIKLPEQRLREQRIRDNDTDLIGTEELNQTFANVLEGSQTGYDLSSQKRDEQLRDRRISRRKLQTEVKRSF